MAPARTHNGKDLETSPGHAAGVPSVEQSGCAPPQAKHLSSPSPKEAAGRADPYLGMAAGTLDIRAPSSP